MECKSGSQMKQAMCNMNELNLKNKQVFLRKMSIGQRPKIV